MSVLLLAGSPLVHAQKSKDQLNKEKKAKLNRIKEVEKILSETSNKKQHSVGELQAINQRIKEQKSLIGSIQNEISYLENDIDENKSLIESLETDLNSLKSEYSAMVYAANKANSGINKLNFLFASSSFSELRARWKYMEQYSEARKKQAEQIVKVQEVLSLQVSIIEMKRNEQQTLLSSRLEESQSLNDLQSQREKIVVSLESQETKLKKDLENQKIALASLEKKITEIINAEIAAARSAAPANTNKTSTNSANNAVLTGSFANNKTKLNWPVDGFVTQKFGKHQHVALKNVVTENDGISIQTKKNEFAKAIFDGDVRYVFFVPTLGYSALIKHGDYFTVYGGLKEPLVKAGDLVKAGQKIGEVVTKPEGVTELWFEIRKGRDPLNPELWLVKR